MYIFFVYFVVAARDNKLVSWPLAATTADKHSDVTGYLMSSGQKIYRDGVRASPGVG